MDNSVLIIEKFENEEECKIKLLSAIDDDVQCYTYKIGNPKYTYHLMPINYEKDIYLLRIITNQTSFETSDYSILLRSLDIRIPMTTDDLFILGKIDFKKKTLENIESSELEEIINNEIVIYKKDKEFVIDYNK